MKLRAPFSYWGAKTRMAPWIVERLPPHTHYVEACAGSAAIMAVKEPVEAETLNDTYGEVVNFFRVLREPASAEALIDRVAFTPYAHYEFIEAGRMLAEADYDDAVQRAWAFFVRMQMAVVPGKSGWSYGVQGASARKANKPGRWETMPELIKLTAQRFGRVQVTQWDVLELIERLDAPGVLILIDPPYIDESRPRSTGGQSAYVHDNFDHEALVRAMQRAEHASFAITHYPHPLYDAALGMGGGDFTSHRNIPSKLTRSEGVERLYLLDRSRQMETVPVHSDGAQLGMLGWA